MSANEEEATSFGSVAGSYDRVRPGPDPAALGWLVPAGCAVAVDLAAGTGLFTSAFITAQEADREAGLDWSRDVLLSRAGTGPSIEMPLRSWCWRADRL